MALLVDESKKNISAELKKLPNSPGVYIHKDGLGDVIYVGKAINLRKRVSQYFRNQDKKTSKLKALVSNIKEFEYIRCETEREALILEANLIKKYMPKYNVIMKDDKSYPYIEITTVEEFSRIRMERMQKKGNKYYGPFSDIKALKSFLNTIRNIYPIKKCKTIKFPKNHKPCLNYHIGNCIGVCKGNISKYEYSKMIAEIEDILSGKSDEIIKNLTKKMDLLSTELRFEEASEIRDKIAAINNIREKERVSISKDKDIDVLIEVITKISGSVVRYKFREKKLIGRGIYRMTDNVVDDGTLTGNFIKQFYFDKNDLPSEILITDKDEEYSVLEEILKEKKKKLTNNRNIEIKVPQKGEKVDILNLAIADANELKKNIDLHLQIEDNRNEQINKFIFEIIKKASRLQENPDCMEKKSYRIESYDISHIGGLDQVGAMVVYEENKKNKKAYRKFKIKWAKPGDDVSSIRETLYRRFDRYFKGDKSFNELPDLVLLDGGLSQVSGALALLDSLNLNIPVAGMAKDDFHRTKDLIFCDGSKVELKKYPLIFGFIGGIQEEVHRFAITYHRDVHSKKVSSSELDNISGIGEKRKQYLFEKFKTVDNIKKKSKKELMEVPTINETVADSIIDYFNK